MAAETYLCNANRLSSRPVPRDRRGFPQAVIPVIGSRRPFCHLLAISARYPPGRRGLSRNHPAWTPLTQGGFKRVKGIEPSSLAWKAIALPLSYTRSLWLTLFGVRGPLGVGADRGCESSPRYWRPYDSVSGVCSCRSKRCLWDVPVARVCLAQANFLCVFGRRTGLSPCRVCRSPSLRRPHCRRFKVFGHLEICYWGVQDSNLRRQCHQIYSLTPLATRETPR